MIESKRAIDDKDDINLTESLSILIHRFNNHNNPVWISLVEDLGRSRCTQPYTQQKMFKRLYSGGGCRGER